MRQLKPQSQGQILCLVGPPGVGKTSIGKSIARAMGSTYVRLSLGGVKDESDIRGHRKTYVGAMPGRIVNALIQAKVNNPLILLDEIDKMANDFRGDPASAMLEVLDGEQNNTFRDHYIELPFDLSKVLFITTANDLSTVSPPLLDRMDVIELSSYTREEKFHIAKEYLVKKQMEKHGLTGKDAAFSAAGLYTLIDRYTREAGLAPGTADRGHLPENRFGKGHRRGRIFQKNGQRQADGKIPGAEEVPSVLHPQNRPDRLSHRPGLNQRGRRNLGN